MVLTSLHSIYAYKVFNSPNDSKFKKNLYSQKYNYNSIFSKNGEKITYFEFKPNNNPKNKCIIWSHGTGTTAYEKYEYFENLAKLINCLIITYDYQGFGLSEGTCSEQNCCEDIESIVNHVKIKYYMDNSNIYLVGKSLGTGIVIDYVSKNNWKNPILLISPYKSILRIKYPNLGNYLGFMDMFNTISKIKLVKCPVQIIHGTADELIDIQHSKDIYEAVENKKFNPIWLEKCGHRNIPLDHNLLISIFDL